MQLEPKDVLQTLQQSSELGRVMVELAMERTARMQLERECQQLQDALAEATGNGSLAQASERLPEQLREALGQHQEQEEAPS